MQHPHSIPGATAAFLLCAALAAFAGNAQAQVNRCVDADGRVTLTDESCPPNNRVVNDDVSDSGAVGLMVTTGAGSAHLGSRVDAGDAVNSASLADPAAMATGLGNGPTTGLTRSRWADLPRTLVRKTAGTDAVTLQTARTTLLMRDELRRQSRGIATR